MVDNQRLIECVKQKDALWNFSCGDYKDIDKVNQLWDRVAMEMNCSKEDAKSKWRLLRTAYLREVEGVKNGNPSNWHLFSSMVFLENNIYENVNSVEKLNIKIVDVEGPDTKIDNKQLSNLKQQELTELQSMKDKSKDTNYLFLASLHPFMKNIPENKKINVRIKILQFLDKYV